MKTILTISGSLRKDSLNSRLATAFHAHATNDVVFEHMDWSALPIFNQDDEANFPESANALKEQIRKADGIIIATPEYNRSIPGALKNMIDWTSRPYGDSAWAGKPVLIVGATGGSVGTALSQADLRKVMLYLDTRVIGQPEFYMTAAQDKFAADGTLTDENTKAHIEGAVQKLLSVIG